MLLERPLKLKCVAQKWGKGMQKFVGTHMESSAVWSVRRRVVTRATHRGRRHFGAGLNPTAGAVEPAASATNATGTTAAPAQAAGFVIRQAGSAAAGTGNVEIDEIRVGTTFAAVTPGAVASVNNNQIAGLKIYPNPVKDGILYIDTQANADKSVTIFDILGKQVVNVSTTANTVNVSSLKDGVYFVKITEADKTATRKLVINN